MVDNKTPTMQIGQLNLSIPGNSAEVGHRVANGIAEHLATQVPPGLKGQFGALKLRVRLPPGTRESAMSQAIAQAIINALQQGGRTEL